MRTLGTLVVLLLIAIAGPAGAAGGSDSLVITSEQVDTSSGGDVRAKAKKVAIKELKGQNEQWTMYFIAFLKKAAGAQEVNLVFYDTADKSKDPTNAFPISTKQTAKILMSSISFGTDQGFKAGHTYDVRVTRLVGGKEDVYARSTITLK